MTPNLTCPLPLYLPDTLTGQDVLGDRYPEKAIGGVTEQYHDSHDALCCD